MIELAVESVHIGNGPVCPDFDAMVGPVSDFPKLIYSNRDVRRAGEVIADRLPWNEETAPKIREAFHIANNWRDAHAYPMRSMRCSLTWYMNTNKLQGIAVARLKRMQAIRRKLRRSDLPQNLTQLQDLGGCRVILDSVADVRLLLQILRDRSRHELWKEDPYIDEPKADGYRCHHLRFKYQPKQKNGPHLGRRIEVQIRTKLQHSWATAVETMGLIRGENLKGNYGDRNWLRFFLLMSAEFAEEEGCPLPPNSPAMKERREEIRELNHMLNATQAFSSVGFGIRWTIEAVQGAKPLYYLITLDTVEKRVSVEPYFHPKPAVSSYDQAEVLDNEAGSYRTNVVLVEADNIDTLKVAYPNYLGDAAIFRRKLHNIVGASPEDEFQLRLQEPAYVPTRENPDRRIFTGAKGRRWN